MKQYHLEDPNEGVLLGPGAIFGEEALDWHLRMQAEEVHGGFATALSSPAIGRGATISFLFEGSCAT